MRLESVGPVIPVLRFSSEQQTQFVAELLISVGFRTVEITLTTPNAFGLIGRLRDRFDASVLIGAGTVCSKQQAELSLAAGADYIVSPMVNEEIVEPVRLGNKGLMMGAFTPTEILKAHRIGADIVKVFPADLGGAKMIKALKAVFNDIRLCPTGGITSSNYRQYLESGAELVGIGSALFGGLEPSIENEQKILHYVRQFL
jgi:2-dehydro-3-deoxyphosphogluconate aldolase/(4S)-4-hydroxy-2-oxoglutarate aldolase